MEYCSACKSILKPEYTFCPFCGAKIPGKPEAEDTGEILLLAKPEPGDVVVYKSWETIEDDLGAGKSGSDSKSGENPAGKDGGSDSETGKSDTEYKPDKEKKGIGKGGWITDDDLSDNVPGKKDGSGKSGDEKKKDSGDAGKTEKDSKSETKPETGDKKEENTPFDEIKKAVSGDTVYLNGTPWHVLWIRADCMLMVAGESVTRMNLTDSSSQVSWRTSRLRKWLNQTFITEFFTPEQREHLCTEKYSTKVSRTDGYDFIESTEEKVTILSREQYQFYVPRSRGDRSWQLFSKPGIIRDLSSNTSGGGKVTTLQVEKDKENWSEEPAYRRIEVYPAIWWRTK